MDSVEQPKQHLQHDGSIRIAVGKSRKDKQWKSREMTWSEFVHHLSQTTRTRETYEEYVKMAKSQQDQVKDVGGFVGGTLKNGRRKADSVVWRHVVTLDADHIKGDLWSSVEMLLDFASLVYSTHKHKPEQPRLRLVFPLSRPVTPDEYQAVSRKIAADIGIDFFDDTTYQPHRLMYWPSTSTDGEYVFHYQDEPWLDPDEVLQRYNNWQDPLEWPESSRVQQVRKKEADKQGDPHEKPGIVGAFCRTYSITEVIENFLPDIYEDSGDGRYSFKEGSTTGGLVIYDDKFAYSHHGTDPLSGQLANAFDLVRIHLFGQKDEDAQPDTPVIRLPSYKEMVTFAGEDGQVKQILGEERLAAAEDEFGSEEHTVHEDNWLQHLEYKRDGSMKASAPNLLLIFQFDPHLKGRIAFDEFASRSTVLDDLPWRKRSESHYWTDRDDASLRNYVEKIYGISHQGKTQDALLETQGRNKYHPVREYLQELEWDGIDRLDTLLIDYLGAQDTEYTRAVTRKMFVAAVARVLNPGCKFDNVLVMVGAQGIGKSYLVKKMGQSWHSDSINTVQGKEAFEQLQGSWLIELAELSATRKAEAEAVKHFISKQEDSYRVAYGRQVSVFPRQCVFFGTTNDMTFLKDKTGNRRFWPVRVGMEERKRSLWKEMDQQEIDQLWAEALHLFHNDEPLYLSNELEEQAKEMQEAHMEESEEFGMIQEYLETPLPNDWNKRDIVERRRYFHNSDFGEQEEGTVPRERVCALEIWVELFEGDPKQMGVMNAREINDILRRMPQWEDYGSKLRFGKLYGLQRAFTKKVLPE